MANENKSHQFERVPATAEDRSVSGRPTREEIIAWWTKQYGIDGCVFAEYSFWEKGAGTIWVFHGDTTSPVPVEALGLRLLRVRQKYWKPTTNGVQVFGTYATRNVLQLGDLAAARFVRGETQSVHWEGDWGYLIVTRMLGNQHVPIGVGLYTDEELKSQIPKSRQRTLDEH